MDKPMHGYGCKPIGRPHLSEPARAGMQECAGRAGNGCTKHTIYEY